MATQTRSFIVFKDEPEDIPAPVVDRHDDVKLSAAAHTVLQSSAPLVFAPDKENIDPSTGSRALSEQSLGKKRKTALAVKAQPASPSKKPRPLAEKPTKKPSSSKTRTADKKIKRTSSKRTNSGRTRREPSLPRLAEEKEEHETLDQVAIDAKCKELTVLPLADISEAYEQAATKEDATESVEKPDEEKVAAVSEEKIARAATPPPPPHKDEEPTCPAAPASTQSVFSTPERKRIYSAFTFSSPSPASQRYASTRGSSVERFSDVVF